MTIETAVRLTGIARGTLAQAASQGNLPVLKTGPGPAPYLIRMRDIITYIVTMWTERRARKELTEGERYIGFPEWLVAEISESWPDNRAFNPGHWQAEAVKIKRGGRPRSRGLMHPHNPKLPGSEKAVPDGGNQPQEAPLVVDEGPPSVEITGRPTADPTTLPKWHPLWRRPE